MNTQMNNALIRLREAQELLSELQYSVAEYILNNPESAMNMTIYQLAKATFSSPSTIIRLCRQVGFNGYKDMRKAITYEVTLRKQNSEIVKKEITRSDSIDDIIEKITYKNILSLEDTKNLLDPNVLNSCVKLLCECNTVLLFGLGASLCAARDAYLKFLRLNKSCSVNEDWHSQYLLARNSTKDDLGLVFSYSGNTTEVVECMKAMKENQTPIIAITRCIPSPVSNLSDYKLYTAANESTFRSGAMSSRISQLNVLDILYTAFVNSNYDYCLKQFSRTHIIKPEMPKKRSPEKITI